MSEAAGSILEHTADEGAGSVGAKFAPTSKPKSNLQNMHIPNWRVIYGRK